MKYSARKKIIVSTLIYILISSGLLAQKPNFKFKSIKASDGLINSTVQAIFEDSYGFIWFGTHHGLQRYDGKTFTNFVSKENDSTGLSHNYINDFCEDSLGNIWIATSIGLNRYIRKKDEIQRYKWKGQFAGKFDDLSMSKVLMDETDKSILWISSLPGGLIKVNLLTDSVTVYPIPDQNNGWVQGLIHHPSQKGKILVGATNAYVFDVASGQFDELFALQQKNDLWNHRINDFVLDPSDNNVLWCATGDIWGRGSNGGLLRYNLKTGESKLFSQKNRPGEVPDVHILQVCFHESNKLWVGTRNYGVLLYDLDQDRFFNYQYNEYDEGSFTTENAIRSMLLDRSGTMWFGTWGDGISVLSPALQKFAHYKHLPGIKDGLPDNWITGITEDSQGNIWIGTKAGGLAKFDPDEKTFEHHLQEFTEPEDHPTEITYVYYDSRDKLWIGTYADALYRYDPVTRIKTHYPKGPGSVSQKRISAITELVPGEILISTYGGGLNIYRYNSKTFKQFMNDPEDPTSIPDNQIWLPFLGDDGNYYFGGNSSDGIIRFNPKTEKFSQPLIRQELNNFLVSLRNSQGRVFVSALSRGLSEIIIGDTISVVTMTDDSGNPITGTEGAVIDKRDRLWLGSSNGLQKYDLETRRLVKYDPDDGLQGYDFYRFAAYRSSSGTMYFGGLNGLNTFNPEEIQLSNYKPPVVFTGFKVFGEELEIGPDSPLEKNILLTEKIELAHAQNDFSISFSGLDYSNPHKIQYKYQLVNHDDDWKIAGNFGVAGYTNMDPGKYTFQVVSTNADGVWNDEVKSLEIIINPPWWQTTTAYVIYGLLFIMVVIVLDRVQRKRLKEKERAQTRERELEQAKEIEKAYNDLKLTQQQLIHAEKMASLGELTAGIAHEIQNPLNFVNNFSDVSVDLIEEMKEELVEGNTVELNSIATDLQQNLGKIHHHGERASSIVRGMLEHSRAGDGKKEPTDLNAMADEYIRLAYHGIRAKDTSFNADFKTDLDENLPKVNAIGQDIARVVLNLINNAFFACAERSRSAASAEASAKADSDYKALVTISTKKLDEMVEIKVTDNGGGIPADIIDKIFQPFFTTKASGEGTGLGLSLSYDIITKGHNGELKVETKENEGTTFIISLPINLNE